MLGHAKFRMAGGRKIELVIAANTADYNIRTAAGSPPDPVEVTVIVNPGVTVNASSTGVFAMTTGTGWAAGTKMTLINNGSILGAGGGGAEGGNPDYYQGQHGGGGGHAIERTLPITIDNTNGYIFAGGGGGGGGGAAWWIYAPAAFRTGGGGGGGGSGKLNAAGGNGGYSCPNGYGTCLQGNAGSPGTDGLGGAGGIGALASGYCQGGTGGNGGNPGEAGGNGSYGSSGLSQIGEPGTGGPPGVAVHGSGLITWLGGNNPTQLRGAIS